MLLLQMLAVARLSDSCRADFAAKGMSPAGGPVVGNITMLMLCT
jgi:hypothetical protein